MFRPLFQTSLVVAAATASTLVVSHAASAAILFTDTASFSDQLTELQGTPLLTLNQFDATGYNVTKVTVTASGSLTSSGTVTNTAPNAQSFRVRTTAEQFNLTPTVGAPAALNPFGLASGETIGQQQQYTSLGSGVTADFGPFSLNLTPVAQEFSTANLINQFLGTGTISVAPTTLISLTVIGGGGNVSTSITTLADATINIVYEGEPIPVPPAFAGLLAFGALGAWKLSRRKQEHLET